MVHLETSQRLFRLDSADRWKSPSYTFIGRDAWSLKCDEVLGVVRLKLKAVKWRY